MCYLRGACRSGDFGESGVDKDGTGAEHERQENLRGLIWARHLLPKNRICSSAESLILERR
jgi:hypothetical protein